MSLEKLGPRQAVEMYLEQKGESCSETTVQAHSYRLKHFIRWCENVKDIDNMNTLGGRHLFEYRMWRKEDGDLNLVTLQTQMSTLRVFIRWCESVDAVQDGLADQMMLPQTSKHQDERRNKIDPEEATKILDYMRKYEYGSAKHVLFELLWFTGMRIGEAHALDVGDYFSSLEYVEIHHRPRSGTALKNKHEGERPVYLNEKVCNAIDDYLKRNRHDIVDTHGREPLFTTRQGRAHKNTLRNWVYCLTRPCVYTNECPHDRDISECEATEYDKAAQCPSSESPHGIRRGSITYHLLRDVPERVVSERMNVSSDVLNKHYDRRSEKERLEQRKKFLDDL